ncbi:MAG: NAD(P)H-binding protein, partial [Anaerolineales bacterium]|nr:NAD(P)H-binding protein [Anaerolineales bacterium]
MNAFVLGATGFIGGAIARAAVEQGWHVRALRRRPSAVGALDDIARQIDWVQGSIEETERLVEAMASADLVFHAAGYYTTRHARLDEHIESAAQQIQQVLDAFRK